ncbi:hypothetical protein ACFX15_027486 [Malus domestica]
MRVDLRNRRGVCFLKSWVAQRPRGSISEIEEAFAFSKAGLLKDHDARCACFLKSWAPCQHLSHALSFAEITGILSKISGETSKHAQPLLTFEKTPNKIACSKIEEAPPSESRELDSQHDYFLKNRRDTALRIS